MTDVRKARAGSPDYDWFHSSWNVVSSDAEDCAISQVHRHYGDCLFVDSRVSSCQARRGEQEIVHSMEDGLYVTFYYTGGLRFLAGNREAVMQTGDILLWDTSEAGWFDCQTEASGRTILFPRKMVERRLGFSSGISGIQSDRRDPRTLLLRSHLEKLHDLAGNTRQDILSELLETSLELTYLCMIDREGPGTASTQAALHEVRKYIRENLGSENLKPIEVADHLGTSVRNLQNVLSTHGTTFTALVSNERMSRAAQLLRSSPPRKTSITEIALTLGFYDQAHFSNAFRRHYGMSPRQYRNRC